MFTSNTITLRDSVGNAAYTSGGRAIKGNFGVKVMSIGFIVEDGPYLSARWPGDAWTLALRMLDLL
mgnify:CR=1 FL=1